MKTIDITEVHKDGTRRLAKSLTTSELLIEYIRENYVENDENPVRLTFNEASRIIQDCEEVLDYLDSRSEANINWNICEEIMPRPASLDYWEYYDSIVALSSVMDKLLHEADTCCDFEFEVKEE